MKQQKSNPHSLRSERIRETGGAMVGQQATVYSQPLFEMKIALPYRNTVPLVSACGSLILLFACTRLAHHIHPFPLICRKMGNEPRFRVDPRHHRGLYRSGPHVQRLGRVLSMLSDVCTDVHWPSAKKRGFCLAAR